MSVDNEGKTGLQWAGLPYAPEPTTKETRIEWELIKSKCEDAANLFDSLAERAGKPRPPSVEYALFLIALDWYNNMTLCGGLERFEDALAKQTGDHDGR